MQTKVIKILCISKPEQKFLRGFPSAKSYKGGCLSNGEIEISRVSDSSFPDESREKKFIVATGYTQNEMDK